MTTPTPREMVRLQVAMAAESSSGEIYVSQLLALCSREFGPERGQQIGHYMIAAAYRGGQLPDARSSDPQAESDG